MSASKISYMVMSARTTAKGGVILTSAFRGAVQGVFKLYFKTVNEADAFRDGDTVDLATNALCKMDQGDLYYIGEF